MCSAYGAECGAVLEPVHVDGGRFVGVHTRERQRQLPLVCGECADGRCAAHLPGPRHVLQRRRRDRARRAGRYRRRRVHCGPRGRLHAAIADSRVAHNIKPANNRFRIELCVIAFVRIYQPIETDGSPGRKIRCLQSDHM